MAEPLALGFGREVAVDEQKRGLEEGRIVTVGERFDVVAAVTQDAGVAIDVSDRGLGCARVHIAVVERDQTGAFPQLRDVDRGFVLGPADHRKLDLFVLPVQDGRLLGHHSSPSWSGLALLCRRHGVVPCIDRSLHTTRRCPDLSSCPVPSSSHPVLRTPRHRERWHHRRVARRAHRRRGGVRCAVRRRDPDAGSLQW